jgi:hypothetical protein
MAAVGWAQGDYSGDGKVNAADLNLLGVNWRSGVAAAATAVANQRVPRAPLAIVANAHPVTDAIFASERDSQLLLASRSNAEVSPHVPSSVSGQDTLLDLHVADNTTVFANDVSLAQARRYRQGSRSQPKANIVEAPSVTAFSNEVDKLFAQLDGS